MRLVAPALLSAIRSIRRVSGYRWPVIRGSRFLPRLCPGRIDVELFPGLFVDLDLRDSTQLTTFVWGSRYEEPTPQVLVHWLRQDAQGTFFDIGSNYGFYSYWVASQCPAAQIFAFEPDERTYAILKRTVERNALARLCPMPIGLTDKRSSLQLYQGLQDMGHSTFGAHPHLKSVSPSAVEAWSFDEWVESKGMRYPATPSWVAKIDVEGFETKVLTGMSMGLQARAFRGLAVEVNDYTLEFCGSSRTLLHQVMRENGYAESRLHDGRRGLNSFFEPIA